jgi:hypothetical protein
MANRLSREAITNLDGVGCIDSETFKTSSFAVVTRQRRMRVVGQMLMNVDC